jgi:hypothetical protein
MLSTPLLDFCFFDPALQLYRRLCRHYFAIDPAATGFYIDAYREMWDPETKSPTRVRKPASCGSRKQARRVHRVTAPDFLPRVADELARGLVSVRPARGHPFSGRVASGTCPRMSVRG